MKSTSSLKKKKKGFLDGYKTYDTSEGFGNPEQWQGAFNHRMNFKEAQRIVKDESPFTILEVAPDSVWETIKKVYRKLAMIWHPDKNPGSEKEATEKMQKIIAAFTILKKKFGM